MQVAIFRHILTVPTMIAIAIAVLFLSSADTTRASFGTPEFTPTFDQRTCNVLPGSFGYTPMAGSGASCNQNNTSGAATDVGIVFDVPAGHHNFSGSLFMSHSRLTFAADAAITDGTPVGGLRSTISLGLTNTVCGATGSLFPEFVFFEGTTTGAAYTTQAEGTPNRWSDIADDNNLPLTTPGGFPQPGAGFADSDSLAVSNYLDFADTFFNGARPFARYVGLTQVPAGADWQLLQIFAFDPAVLRAAFNNADDRTSPFARVTPSMGTVLVTLLNDPTATNPAVSVITDFCSPLGTTTGLVGVATMPSAAGNHLAGVITQSIRDADSDGFDNGFDTCPWGDNLSDQYPPNYNSSGGNNLDDVCENGSDGSPDYAADFGSGPTDDTDDDGFQNAGDICPQIANATPDDSEPGQTYVIAAPDGGPRSDLIGDDCDAQPTIANGGFFQVHFVDSNCVGADADDDGWCDGTSDFEATYSQRIVHSATNSSPDQAGTAAETPNNTVDHDGDGVNSGNEVLIGTDPSNDCPLIAGQHDAWPPDFDRNRVINTTDVFQVLPPVLGSVSGGSSFTVRADLAPGGVINTTDVFQVLPPVLGSTCTP